MSKFVGAAPSVMAQSTSILTRRPRRLAVRWLYFVAIIKEFRWTLALLCMAVALGTALYRIAPPGKDRDNSWPTSFYGGWMALVAQPLDNPPQKWYLEILCGVYPVFGLILLGEGVVRLSFLMVSRRRGEKEWMLVMASTYRDHVILCGLGHLGFRVLEQLRSAGVDVVCIEFDGSSRLVAQAKAMGVAVLVRDMTEDQALVDAGVLSARAIVVATGNDIANLEVALDSRRVNPKIRVLLRLFDQQLASKISEALAVDAAFSSSTLAAPVIAGLALGGHVLSASIIGGVQYLTAKVVIAAGSQLVGCPVVDIESRFVLRVLAVTDASGQTQSPPKSAAISAIGDNLIVHATVDRLKSIMAEAGSVSEVTRY
jgi:voltage-gated potassium channel